MFRAVLFLAACAAAAAQMKFSPADGWKPLFNGRTIEGWRALDPAKANNWEVAGGVLRNGPAGRTVNLVSSHAHGDLEAYLEFMVPKDSNSGVYFQGLYEIQILDSFGKKELSFSDCGGIYARYIDGKVVGGTPPRVNASKAPGEWQSFRATFRAPRFDSAGRKTENARFLKVIHNGVTIHENVEVDGPTRASMTGPEAASGPLMLQGDHGPVSYRNIYVRSLK